MTDPGDVWATLAAWANAEAEAAAAVGCGEVAVPTAPAGLPGAKPSEAGRLLIGQCEVAASVRLIEGDCVAAMATMEKGGVRCGAVVTDPPYG